MEPGMALCIKISCFGNRAKADPDNLMFMDGDTGEASSGRLDGADMLRVAKNLIQSEELAAIKALDGELKLWFKSRSIPSMLKGGIYQFRHDDVLEVDAKLEGEYIPARRAAVIAFLEAYPRLTEEAKGLLGSNFAADDYPSIGELKRSFKVKYEWIEVGVPGALKKISDALFQREKEKAITSTKNVAAHCNALLRAELDKMVTQFAERLTPDAPGKKKRFRKAMASDFCEALNLLKNRWSLVSGSGDNDAEMVAAMERAEAVVKGIDPKSLADESTRAAIAATFTSIKDGAAKLVETAPRRAVDVD